MIFLYILAVAGILSHTKTAADDQPPTRECGGQHVCTTLMKYKDGTVVDEGDNCYCREGVSSCSKEWVNTHGDNSLTWQHYERAHWTVQYRFCTNVFQGKKQCQGDEMAAVVETDIKKWEPLVDEPRCVCGADVSFKIMGWKRVGNKWKYFYKCEKEECPRPSTTLTEQSACARIYIDVNKYNDKVLEVEFLCNCPDGYMCPTKFDEKADSKKVMQDNTGNYVVKYCDSIMKQKISSLNES
ncbi:uncharacterized protein LOC129923761 [Biomphalaria glabrata]|uniref:Uncharacterized protein LOC129923761 n=1 Tax=Biomphalaria glabrata TaxID=6526 RepID=A0A9W2ZBI5_BIOGL|nr:uncharacterized protein LOC129923761 [Biomphalaria glabrata]